MNTSERYVSKKSQAVGKPPPTYRLSHPMFVKRQANTRGVSCPPFSISSPSLSTLPVVAQLILLPGVIAWCFIIETTTNPIVNCFSDPSSTFFYHFYAFFYLHAPPQSVNSSYQLNRRIGLIMHLETGVQRIQGGSRLKNTTYLCIVCICISLYVVGISRIKKWKPGLC